jgi:glycosyltransferase involved in cell wall biosynthesis
MKISVVIPVRNEQESIGSLLDNLLAQRRVPDEIVITDGGSTDRTARIIEEYIERGAPVRLILSGAALPGRGRNLAASQASHDWLAFIDAGIRPATDWLGALAREAEHDESVDVVYGLYEPITDSFFKECAAIAYVPPPVETGGARLRPRSIASALMRRDVWRAAGGFPENLRSAEDLLFMDEVERLGFKHAHTADAVVHWNIQPTLWRTFKRFVTYSRSNIRAGLWRNWQAAIFKRYLLILLLSLPAFLVGWWWLVVTMAVWLLLILTRSVVALRRNRYSYPGSVWRNALRLLWLAPLVATLDAATFVGSINWLFADKLHLAGGAVDVHNGA